MIDVTVGLPIVGHEAAHAGLGAHDHAGAAGHATGSLDPTALLTKAAECAALLGAWALYSVPGGSAASKTSH